MHSVSESYYIEIVLLCSYFAEKEMFFEEKCNPFTEKETLKLIIGKFDKKERI